MSICDIFMRTLCVGTTTNYTQKNRGMGFARCPRCLQHCNTNAKLAINHNGEIMEDILELILTILFKPFESKFDNIFGRINNIHSKGLRVLLRIVLIAIPVALIIGICCLCSYLFRGYWI